MRIVDPTFGLSKPARALLVLLENEDEQHEFSQDENIRFHTYAWYNGRERGVAVVMHTIGMRQPACVVVFGEHRNSDAIFVDTFTTTMPFDPPTLEAFTDEAYKKRETFNPDKILQARKHICKILNGYYLDYLKD